MNDDLRAAIEQSVQVFAREAGRQALELQSKLSKVSSKDGEELIASNVVTEADERVGGLAESFFGRMFPGCVVIQEETLDQFDPGVLSDDSLVFVVDPIDGTLFYANRSWAWAISVGVFHRWEPIVGCVYAPQIEALYHTEGEDAFLNGERTRATVPDGTLKGAVMLRHIKAYHNIDSFPGYTLSYGSIALHLAMVAGGSACSCVASRHRVYDVAGGAKLLANAGAELRYLNGEHPSWRDLLLAPGERAPDFFFACPQGEFERLSQYVELQTDPS